MDKIPNTPQKSFDWKKYAFEFLAIFIAVIAAFALDNWNDNRKNRQAENKILSEILHGLDKDLEDVNANVLGHKKGLNACDFWQKIVVNQAVSLDSLPAYYFLLTRDFISIQNTSGYKTLQSRGLELIENDSLRASIISLYEYDYNTLRKMEEEYNEAQFQKNYFHEINRAIAPNFQMDTLGNIRGLDLPLNLAPTDQKVLVSYLWKIKFNRQFILTYYENVTKKIDQLKTAIEQELN